jgi:hypothetical protein
MALEDLKITDCPFGPGEVLLTVVPDGEADRKVTCVAPVGVRVRPDEGEATLDRWRMATWASMDDLHDDEQPVQTRRVPVAQVAAALREPELRAWILSRLVIQRNSLRSFAAFAQAAPDADPEELAEVQQAIDAVESEMADLRSKELQLTG